MQSDVAPIPKDVHINFAHGLGDCANFAALAWLYHQHGVDVRVSGEENKRLIWDAANLNPDTSSPSSVDHSWWHPNEFWNADEMGCVANKVAGNINVAPLPTINRSVEELWKELCALDLPSLKYSDEVAAERDQFLKGLPEPIVAIHAVGTNGREDKSIDATTQLELQQHLVEAGYSVVILDFDSRAVQVGHERIRGIKPTWGHLSLDRLAGLLSKCALLIAVDSGPLHFARIFTRVPILGVFYDRGGLLPDRVAVPSSRLTSMVPKSHHDRWQFRLNEGHGWKFAEYEGSEPTATEIATTANAVVEGTAIRQGIPIEQLSVAGRYTYRRIGYDQRPVELRSDGMIGEGAGGNERRWQLRSDGRIEIHGDAGVIAYCSLDHDGVWRGRWVQFERMLIEFVPIHKTAPPTRSIRHHCEHVGTRYFSTADLWNDAISLSRLLPPIRAVAGVPRSGLLPATAIALELNVPMVSLDSLLRGEPVPPSVRRRQQVNHDGIVLVVDESAAAGVQLSQLRERLPDVKTAVIYCDERATDVVDFYHSQRDNSICIQEWTLFHDDNNEYLLTDMDGVLCEDWHGGDEEQNAAGYLEFLKNAKPRRIPSTDTWPLLAIVTGRMEKHRRITEDWLARHGIKYSALIMAQQSSAAERDAADTAVMKACEYSQRANARVFVESCAIQSRRIQEITGRPVLCVEANSLV